MSGCEFLRENTPPAVDVCLPFGLHFDPFAKAQLRLLIAHRNGIFRDLDGSIQDAPVWPGEHGGVLDHGPVRQRLAYGFLSRQTHARWIGMA